MDLRHSFNIHLLSMHAVNTSASEGLKQRGRLTRCHLDMWETLAIIKDDIYVYCVEGVISRREKHGCRRFWRVKFSSVWHKQIFQMTQYLHRNNTSWKTTFVNEVNLFFYQHVA